MLKEHYKWQPSFLWDESNWHSLLNNTLIKLIQLYTIINTSPNSNQTDEHAPTRDTIDTIHSILRVNKTCRG